MELLTINEKKGSNYILYELSGSCNSYTSAEFQNKVLTNIKATNVVVDLSQVTDMDSTGMGILFAGYNDGLEAGHKLYLMNMSPSAQKTVTDTGFIDAFKVIQSVTEVD